jgi:3-isopropylmalate/(R)-2-methylmalate dehydratase small subunit
VIAPSFADIFYNNCFKNGILPVVLKNSEIDELLEFSKSPNNSATVNLLKQEIQTNEKIYKFEIDSFKKHCLIEGLDDIGLTLQKESEISAFENRNKNETPWLYN